ncbi:MAG TPA: hypothetical protein VHE81_07795 [Lacipirellulaceae bacterium]|jgi:hypothetical protein|nr:hypothetical protein [Lacipirellulaceae bacterium]
MSILGQQQFVERLKFFNGQRLFAEDLDSIDQLHREMRWLHNQSLHQPGVGRGFAVSGVKGSKTIDIQEGYAIDSDGREIVLTLPRTEQIPPVAGSDGVPAVYDLAVSYPSDDDLVTTETRQGICTIPGAVRLREEPVFCWVAIGGDGQPIDADLKSRIDSAQLIRLCRASILNCQLASDISIAERRNARPSTQPYIGAGSTGPKTASRINGFDWTQTPSDSLTANEVSSVRALSTPLVATISTTSAGFRTTPSYFVEVRGTRVQAIGSSMFVIDGVPTVRNSNRDSFVIAIDVVVQRLSGEDALQIVDSFFADWEIAWMGVEG